MEALNSASLGAMGSLLRKLQELLHNENWAPNIGRLIEDVGNIRTKLVKLSGVHEPPLTVSCWMIDARELSYDLEDCLDQADALAPIAWIDEIFEFSTRAKEVIERFERFKLEYILSHPTVPNTVVNNRLGTVYSEQTPTVTIGMESPTNKLLGMFEPKGDDENELSLKVVSIFGAAGIGKSMLAHELWWKLREGIQCRAFVQAAKKPDMRMMLRSILLQIRPHQPLEVCQVPNLIHDIRKHLEDKRYFIIIDDIWAISFWDVISRAFPDGYCCSRIITTTTVEDVALACCSYDPDNIFKMKPLSDNHSKELFISTVFGSGKGCPQQFQDVSHDITRKCGGLPLAITCIATLVASLPATVQHWEYVQNFLYHNLRTNSSSEEVLKQVLKLCFSSLPEFLKTCLLYLSVYPENYILIKEDLVKQWIAEGFICTMDGRENIEVAQSYFDEIVSLGLIQRRDINSKKKGRLSYAVHPVVFDFITCKSLEDNFITIIDYSQSAIQLSNKIRRLSLHFGSATYATTPVNVGLSQVRSLAFMGLLCCIPSIAQFKLVRVVILHICCDNGDEWFSLSEICELLLIRYLQVRCNVTVHLPDRMESLKHLETLEIIAEVEYIPSDLIHLSKLQHVRLGEKTTLIPGQIDSFKAFFSVRWNSVPSPPVFLESLELLPPICVFSRLPLWFRQLHKLRILKIAVRKLQDGIEALEELPVLTHLSLYVYTPTPHSIIFRKNMFPALEDFKFVCGVLLLRFLEESLPNLRKLKVVFNAHNGEQYNSNMLVGIEHLSKLEKVAGSIGADPGAEESERIAAESAFKYAIRKHPRHRSFEQVKRIDSVDSQLKKPSWLQQGESSKNRGEQVPVWKLAFESQPELPICAGTKIKDVNGDPLKVILVNVQGTGSPSELPGKLSIEVLPLDGNFPEDWTADEFTRAVVGDCGFRRFLHSRHSASGYQLLTGDVRLTMRNGCATVGELQFTDNLYRSHYRKFRIGARVLPGSYVGGRIVEAITTAFTVETGPVVLADPVWRLDWLHKDGWLHKKLEDNNIDTVQEFVRMLMVKPDDLRSILGNCRADYKRKWDEITKRARTCVPGDKVYVYITARGTIYVNSVLDLVKVEIGGIEYPMEHLNTDQMTLVLQLIDEAYEHRHELQETNAVTYNGQATDNNSLLRARFLAHTLAALQQLAIRWQHE